MFKLALEKAEEPEILFQILKDDAVKALHSICQQIWITQQWPHYSLIVVLGLPIVVASLVEQGL